jgi:hypothetical protein
MSKLPSLAPKNMAEAMDFSKMLATSNMVPKQYQGKPQDILVAVQWGYEVGLPPLQALQNIAVINGKPSVYGDALLALVKNDPRCAGVLEVIDGDGDARTATCTIKRRYGDEIEVTTKSFSVSDAKLAGLWGRTPPWKQYPDRMLQMRARGFAVRDAFPDALSGAITREEAEDYNVPERDVTPPPNPLDRIEAPKPEPKPAPAPEVVAEQAIEAEVIEAEPGEMFQMLTHQGKKMGPAVAGKDAFLEKLLKTMDTYTNTEKDKEGKEVEPRKRMSLLREFKESNWKSIEQLEKKQETKVVEKYNNCLAKLGAQINDKPKV